MEESDYSRGKRDGLEEKYQERMRILEKQLSHWKIAFGWTLAGIIILAIVGLIIIGSNTSYVGYTPEQVGDIAIKICKELVLK